MKIIFLGLLYSKEQEEILLKNSKVGLPNACNIYQWNLIEGLEENLGEEIKIINSIPVGNFPKLFSKLFIRSRIWGNKNYEVGFINFYFIKHLVRKVKIYKKIKEIINNDMDESYCILAYDMYLPFFKVMNKIKLKYSNIMTCAVITDLPGEMGYDKGKKWLAKKILEVRGKKEIAEAIKLDRYVLLTNYMKEPLNCLQDEFVVIEGMINNRCGRGKVETTKKNEKIIFYTGSLAKQYGLDDLLKAFSLIKNNEYRLWLCGQGDMVDEIKKAEKNDKRIKYYGYISKTEVKELEKKITVFINPRRNNGEYTKYSFPSKTMEYLLAGKPIIAYKLDGIPDEYDKYINYVYGDKVEDLKNTIINVCENKDNYYFDLAIEGKSFVENEKNNVKQTQKILDMINKFYKFT